VSLKIEKTFTLEAPLETVWAFLTDPYRVVGCLPGAEVTEKIDERTYAAAVTVKVGPVSATYKGRMQFERLDVTAGEAELVGRGQDVKGKGGAEMRMVSRLRAVGPARTEVTVSSEVTITGRLAQFGRGMIEEVADQMFARFAACVSERLEAAGAAEPPHGASGSVGAPVMAGGGVAVAAGGTATAAGGTATAAGGRTATQAPPRPAPFRVLPLVLKALGQWLTRPFRRLRKSFRAA
jgi:carbon monoxide dehydrogenase subunit G